MYKIIEKMKQPVPFLHTKRVQYTYVLPTRHEALSKCVPIWSLPVDGLPVLSTPFVSKLLHILTSNSIPVWLVQSEQPKTLLFPESYVETSEDDW